MWNMWHLSPLKRLEAWNSMHFHATGTLLVPIRELRLGWHRGTSSRSSISSISSMQTPSSNRCWRRWIHFMFDYKRMNEGKHRSDRFPWVVKLWSTRVHSIWGYTIILNKSYKVSGIQLSKLFCFREDFSDNSKNLLQYFRMTTMCLVYF